MAATTVERNTPQMADIQRSPLSWPQAAGTILKGTIVVLNAAGFAEAGTTATAKVSIGRATKTQINGGAAGSVSIQVEEGVFKWANDGADLVVAADRGLSVYILDNQTVSHTATGKSVAGKCIQIDTDGVWVRTAL